MNAACNLGLRKALVYCTDAAMLPFALFSAHAAIACNPGRDFDVLICSDAPLAIPAPLAALGIESRVLRLPEGFSEHTTPGYRSLPAVAFMRLWLASALGGAYDRILYLDADTKVVSRELDRLLSLDIGSHPFAAVRDVIQWRHSATNKPIYDFAERGINATRYLNSGMLLIDTRTFNEQQCLERMLHTHATLGPFSYHDQSLLNLTFLGQWAELSPVWNWHGIDLHPLLSKYADPEILHFTGNPKPWEFSEKSPWCFWYSQALIAEYREFLQGYFPDRVFVVPSQYKWIPERMLLALKDGRGLKQRIKKYVYKYLYIHVHTLMLGRGLRRYLDRFPTKWHCIT